MRKFRHGKIYVHPTVYEILKYEIFYNTKYLQLRTIRTMKCFCTCVKTGVSVKDLSCEVDIEAGLLKARDTMSILQRTDREGFHVLLYRPILLLG